MNLYVFVGGELVDPAIPESEVKFNYSIFADTLSQAKDKFYKIFPSCFIVKHICTTEPKE